MDKLVKAVNSMKLYNSGEESVDQSKKDHISLPNKSERQENCRVIVAGTLSSQVKNSAEFPALLGVALETLLQSCHDDEVDVRLAAEESLNRIIKSLDEQFFGKIHLELYKEIKKNASSRTLKAALVRFSNLVHKIRPNKCRPYILSLLPVLVKISQRQEDLIQESLTTCMPKIFSCLGSFAGESELKNFLVALLKNLSSESAVIRRTAATCIYEIIKNARNKTLLLNEVVEVVLGNVSKMSHSKNDVIGGLMILRNLIPLIVGNSNGESGKIVGAANGSGPFELAEAQVMKIVEMCIFFFCHRDTGIVTASLETLQSLLKVPSRFLKLLTQLDRFEKTEFSQTLTSTDPATVPVKENSVENICKDVLEDVLGRVIEQKRNSNGENKPEVTSLLPQQSDRVEATLMTENTNYVNQIEDIYKDDPTAIIAKLLYERMLCSSSKNQPDVRVSVKNIALSCLSYLIKAEPRIFLMPVTVFDGDNSEIVVYVADVLSYTSHYDPHLQGCTYSAVAHYISSALIESKNDYEQWLSEKLTRTSDLPSDVSIQNLVSVLCSGFVNPSSVTNRACISAAGACVRELMQSQYILWGMKLLSSVAKLKDTTYWLVKVDILDFFSSIKFPQLLHVEESSDDLAKWHGYSEAKRLQQDIISYALEDLNHSDARVRTAASNMLVASIANLDVVVDCCLCDMATSEAAKRCKMMFHATGSPSSSVMANTGNVKTLLKVYRGYESPDLNKFVSHNLSVLVGRIASSLACSNSKYLTQGCIQVLVNLTEHFPVSQYPSAYGCDFYATGMELGEQAKASEQQHLGLIPVLSSLLNSSWLTPDVGVHSNVLLLAGNFLSGCSLHGFHRVGPNPKITEQESLFPNRTQAVSEESNQWSSIVNPTLALFANKFFSHIMKLISIFHHVIADITPSVQNKSVLPSLPTTQSISSPLKKKEKSEQKDTTNTSDQSANKKTGTTDDSEKEKSGKAGVKSPFTFAHSRVYMKLYELLLGAYDSYKTTIDSDSNERFCMFLHTVLDVMCQILEIATFSDVEKYTEEVLLYFKSTFIIEPTLTVQAVQQLLKGLFGTNLVSQIEIGEHLKNKTHSSSHNGTSQPYKSSFYHQVFHHPLNDLTMAIANASFHHYLQRETTQKAGSGWFGSIKKKVEKKLTMTVKRTKGDKMSIQNYIRLFESMVIKSLKNYTMTSSVEFQKQVLNLLAQLVQLRVNYCLLDSDQIFIGFIIKQFEAIEGGLIKNSESLIPHVFFFLVLLSYEKHHSKTVMTMSKIIQLCDGVMASSCDTSSHAIPSLQPIVHDLFLLRGNVAHDASSDLDTQREVIQSMLFRIVQYPQVLSMITMILQYYRKENPEQWKKSSRQVTDVILPNLTHLKINIFEYRDMASLHHLFEALSPNALRPIDLLLNIFFLLPSSLSTITLHHRWMMKTLALLRVLLCHSKEDYILLRIKEMHVSAESFSVSSLSALVRNSEESKANSDTSILPQTDVPSEEVLSTTFIQLIGFTANRLVKEIYTTVKVEGQEKSVQLLAQLLSEFLLTIIHMCRSGSFKKLTVNLNAILNKFKNTGTFYSAEHICDAFSLLGSHFPVVTLLWSQLLACIGFTDISHWKKFTENQSHGKSTLAVNGNGSDCLVLNREIVRRGSIIMLADYISQNHSQSELLSWLIKNHILEIIKHQGEPPIQDLVSVVHGSSDASKILLEAVQSLCASETAVKPSLKKKILYCMKGVNVHQSHLVVDILLRNWFLFSPILSVHELSMRMACERLEIMLSRNQSEETKHLILSSLPGNLKKIENSKNSRRFYRLTLLIERLSSQLKGDLAFNSPSSRQGKTDLPKPSKDWFKSMATLFCSSQSKSQDIAKVLNVLDYEDILEIMKSDSFSFHHIEGCVTYGISEITCPTSATVPYPEDITNALLKASLEVLVSELDSILSTLPSELPDPEKNVFELNNGDSVTSKYWEEMFKVLQEDSKRHKIMTVCKVLTRCFVYRNFLEHPFEILAKMEVKVLRLMTLCFEAIIWCFCNGIETPICDQLISLEFMLHCLQRSETQLKFYTQENLYMPLIIGKCLHILIKLYSNEAKICNAIWMAEDPNSALNILKSISSPSQIRVALCQLMDRMYENGINGLPTVLENPLRFAMIQLLSHPFLNNMARLPPLLVKRDMAVEELESLSQEKSGEYLQDICVLKEFINRVNSLGWINRMQFEETWTSLLGVLVSQPIGDSSQNATPVDDEAVSVSCLTIRALTTLVVNSCMKPHGGKPATGAFQTVPRTSTAKVRPTRIGRELSVVQCIIERELREITYGDEINEMYQYYQALSNTVEISDTDTVVHDVLRSRLQQNIEKREKSPLFYGLGQRSVQSFRALYNIMPMEEEVGEISTDEENLPGDESSDDSRSDLTGEAAKPPVKSSPSIRFQQQRVDAHSCVQFMIDLFSEWFHSASTTQVSNSGTSNVPVYTLKLPRQFLCECLSSLLLISDFFTERQQFEWMFSSLNSLHLVQPPEDEVMLQYIVLGMCKAGAVLGMNKKICSIVESVLELSFDSTLISTQTFALQGALYLLECEPKDCMKPIINTMSRFSSEKFKNLNMGHNMHSQQLLRNVIAVGFYLIEKWSKFISNIHGAILIQGAIAAISSSAEKPIPNDIYFMLIKNLEVLITSYSLSSVDCDAVAKLAADQFTTSKSLPKTLGNLSLMVLCMYYRTMRVSQSSVSSNSPGSEEEELEARLLSMERITLLFEKIKTGLPHESCILIQLLPKLLDSFFSTQDRMNKVIGEFVSSLHPFPNLIAVVLHDVFQALHSRGEGSLVCEWVMLSLGNFTQRTPISTAVWCLTCVFISASTDHWINSLLPIVLSKMNCNRDDQDYQNFYVAAKDFYVNQLREELDRRSFHSIFKAVAVPGSPYEALLGLIDEVAIAP